MGKTARQDFFITADAAQLRGQGAVLNCNDDYTDILHAFWKQGALKKPAGPMGSVFMVLSPQGQRVKMPPHTPGTQTQYQWLTKNPIAVGELGVENMVAHLKGVEFSDTTISQARQSMVNGIQNGMSFILVEDPNGVLRVCVAPWNIQQLFDENNIK